MFFIPIAAVIIFIWFLVHLYMGYNEGKYNYEQKVSSDRTKALESVAVDEYAESQIKKEITGKNAEQILRDYLPSGDEWDFYASNADKTECALLVRMAATGKIPEHFVWPFGSYLRVKYDLPPADLQRCTELNEQFLLMIESDLLKRGINTVLLFQRQNPKTGPWTPMRDYREKNGSCFTDNSYKYRFTSR